MLEVEYAGTHRTIAWYEERGGTALGRDYYLALPAEVRAKFASPIRYIGDQPNYRNREKFTNEGSGIWALKIFKHRLIGFWDGPVFIITHGFPKKSDAVPHGEKDRSLRLRDEYLERRPPS